MTTSNKLRLKLVQLLDLFGIMMAWRLKLLEKITGISRDEIVITHIPAKGV